MVWTVLRAPAWAAFRTVSRLYLMLSGRKYRYVFILGHMRSGSSLLAHILASHPDFVGAGETHVLYCTPADLSDLVLKTCELLRRPILRETYIVDQINHEYVTNEVLASQQLYKCIILLREPEATLKSMMSLAVWGEKQALEIYIHRLRVLAQYGSVLGDRALFVEYDDLVDHSDETLAALTLFLSLDSPLTRTYSSHRMTAQVAGYGDPSDSIKTGQIIRTPKHEIAVSKDTLLAAATAFHEFRNQLQTTTAQAVNRRAFADASVLTGVLNE